MEIVTVKAEPRAASGTRVARALRATGRLPVIIYGHGEKPEMVSLPRHDVEVALAHGARTLEVALSGTTKKYLIKDVQYDHLGHDAIHVDLTRVDLDERVTVRVGVELRGVPQGVSGGGVLDQHLADLEIECLVTEIPETLHPIVTELALGESWLVKDLELPAGVVALTGPDERVATVRALLEAAEPEAAEEAEEATVEPEVIGRVRKEEENKGAGQS
jgi:large subunit ribosomal protein L25